MRLQQPPELTLHVLNLHLVSVQEALDLRLVLALEIFVSVLQRDDAAHDTVVRHLQITKDPLAVIDNPSLVIDGLVQLEQFLSLQRLGDLRLLQCE